MLLKHHKTSGGQKWLVLWLIFDRTHIGEKPFTCKSCYKNFSYILIGSNWMVLPELHCFIYVVHTQDISQKHCTVYNTYSCFTSTHIKFSIETEGKSAQSKKCTTKWISKRKESYPLCEKEFHCLHFSVTKCFFVQPL